MQNNVRWVATLDLVFQHQKTNCCEGEKRAARVKAEVEDHCTAQGLATVLFMKFCSLVSLVHRCSHRIVQPTTEENKPIIIIQNKTTY